MRIEEPGGPDAVTIHPDRPVYQVEIFTRLSIPFDVPEDQRAFHVAEWKIHDADVPEVLGWAEEQAAGRHYTVSVAAAEEPQHNYLIRLFGSNPLTQQEAWLPPHQSDRARRRLVKMSGRHQVPQASSIVGPRLGPRA